MEDRARSTAIVADPTIARALLAALGVLNEPASFAPSARSRGIETLGATNPKKWSELNG